MKRYCSPRPGMDADFVVKELALHVGSAITLGLLLDTPWTLFRRRVVDSMIEGGRWGSRSTRKTILYVITGILHLLSIFPIFWIMSQTIPCIIQDWQYSLEGMFFPAIFFALQTNFFICITGFYDVL